MLFILLKFPHSAIREIKMLKMLRHENVIRLKEVVTSTGMHFMIVYADAMFTSQLYSCIQEFYYII